MAENLGQLFNTLSDDFGPGAINLFASIIAASLLSWFLIFCLLIILFRYDRSKEDKAQHIDSNNNIDDNRK